VLLGALLSIIVLLALTCTSPASAQEPSEGGESIRGALVDSKGTADRADDEPVEGAEITVRVPGGEDIDTVDSDADGEWIVEVDGPGAYEVEIDPDSLPDGVKLRDEDRTTIQTTLNPGQTRTLSFPLGADTRHTVSGFEDFLQRVVLGINFGLIIAMMAVGLSLIFGTTGLTNFAHAEMVTFGALVAYFFNQTVGLPLVVAALLAMVIGGAAGGLFDFGVWRPLRRRKTGLIAMLVVSIGLSIFLRYVFLYQFGGRTRPYGDYNLQRAIDLGPVSIVPKDLWSIGISLTVLLIVGALLQATRIGKAMRAVADNPDLAASSGIDVDRVVLFVWVSGGALAALGGVLLGLGEQVGFEMGFKQLLLMFAGITLGGLGTAYGALIGSFIIGLVVQVSTVWVPSELNAVTALVVLIGILLVRPQGILGQAERIG
jgi:branched-chain amino acid transport system permease protein